MNCALVIFYAFSILIQATWGISTVAISKTSWWVCSGCAETCLLKVITDVEMNLSSKMCACPCSRRPALPAQIHSLQSLSKSIRPRRKTQQQVTSILPFDEEMELLANIIVQKSRYCIFDAESYGRLISLIY